MKPAIKLLALAAGLSFSLGERFNAQAHNGIALPIKKKIQWYLVLKPKVAVPSKLVCGPDLFFYRGNVPEKIRQQLDGLCLPMQQKKSLFSNAKIKQFLNHSGIQVKRLLGSKVLITSDLKEAAPELRSISSAHTKKLNSMVKLGEQIKVSHKRGGIGIELLARALGNAHKVGDVIRAKSGKRTFRVKVIAPGEAILLVKN